MTDLYVSHAPVFKVDGDVKHDLGRDLFDLEIEETTAGLRTCVVRLGGIGTKPNETAESQLYLDGQIVDFGKQLEITIGPADDERSVFKGRISAIEANFEQGQASQVTVFAEDALMNLRMTRRSKTYTNKSDAQIASDIATANGLQGDCDAPGPTYDVVQQFDQSDLAFLRERAALIQAELWTDGDKLYFKGRGSRSGTTVTLVAGDDLLSVKLRADLAHQRTKVKVSGYDASARDVIDEEAGEDAISAEVESGRTGPAVLKRAFGERVSYRVRDVPLASPEATQWAKAEMLRRARGFVRAWGITRGTADLTVGSRVELQRVGGPFSGGGWYVTRVRHTYDLKSGHRTRFEAERPTVSEAP